MAAAIGRRVGVVHSTHSWLAQTMTWKYTQLCFLPERIVNCVVCDEIINLDQFPTEHLFGGARDSAVWRFLGKHSWRIAMLRNILLIRACARRFDADILHSHFGDHAYRNIGNAARNGLRHVVSFYGYDATRMPHVDERWYARYRELFETVAVCLCEGPHMGSVLAALGCPEEKVRVQHLGVDVDRIVFRARTWRPGETLKVLISGAFVEKKGFPYAIEALSRIKDRVNLELTLIGDTIGQARSIEEKARILEALDRAALRTRLLGFVPYSTLIEESYKHHLFLSPSVVACDGDTEGGAPVSIIEMAASGMPVVSTTHCDIPAVLPGSAARLLAAERDVEGLEERLLWLITNPDQWAEIVTDARRHIEAEFNAPVQGRRLAAVYDSVVL